MEKFPRILQMLFLLALFASCATGQKSATDFHRKYHLRSKFDINALFTKFNGPADFPNPDPRPPLVLILLKAGCVYSKRFQRKLVELFNNFDKVALSSRFELKVFDCPEDETCAKIFNARSYPEIRFYSMKDSPRKFFIRYRIRGKILIKNVLTWMMKHRNLADGRMDLHAIESKRRLDDGSKDPKHVQSEVQKEHSKVLRQVQGQLKKAGYFFAHLSSFAKLDFWKHMYQNIISKKKQLIVFCRDSLDEREYFNFRKIVALYPNVRTFEIQKCAPFLADPRKEQVFTEVTKLTHQMFSAQTKTWSPDLAAFMLKTFTKVLANLWSGGNPKIHFINLEHFYYMTFKKNTLQNVNRFRSRFKAKSRPLVMHLTSSVLRRIMHKSHPAVFLFLGGTELARERRSMIRSFKETSKLVRFDKNMFFVIIGGRFLGS